MAAFRVISGLVVVWSSSSTIFWFVNFHPHSIILCLNRTPLLRFVGLLVCRVVDPLL